ncbi:hypothetical protein PVAP13_3KG481603 [Panicum virgatum]|uniref:Uncharacterized protein n=1 Tax=Panicum virgatum TaxID=38727 RepID=A0A8T0V1F8_PANVG|nr:hypothetical protein PVAP13_3KG481603 [Panicum virgatum]KAG2630282.1 hypothetical protein PVAP13_3KG481603 [Panicum virgatum]
MSTVRIRATNDEVFEVGSEWLPMLHKSEHLQLPIKSKQVMDDLVYYVRQCDKILRLPRKPRKEEGRVVRRRIDVAAVDARATGAVAGRGISADDQMEAFRRSFVSNRDRAALTDIGKAAIALEMWDLAAACFHQMLLEGLNQVEASALLWGEGDQ